MDRLGGELDVPEGVMGVRDFVKEALESALGATITDTGGGLGGGDIWFNYEGREYFLHVEPSGNRGNHKTVDLAF